MRFLTPVVFALAAAGLLAANHGSSGTTWYLPFEAVIPALSGDYATQGQLTVVLFAALAVVTGSRAWRAKPEA